MKKIGIDARLYFQTGVGVYLRNLIYELDKHAPKNFKFYVFILETDFDKVHFNSTNFIKIKAPYKWHSFSEQINFAALLYAYNLDLMHFTYFGHPILYKRKFISTVHDTILLEHKTGKATTKGGLIYNLKHKAFQLAIKNQVKNSEAIITPTQTIKKKILDYYGYSYKNKIAHIYEGVDYKLRTAAENKDLGKKFNKPFFLYVGNFYPHKNVERLIHAFAQIKTDDQLVLRGPNDYFARNILELIKQLKQEKRIIFYDRYSNEDMVFFYKNALALVHPSLSEGFGLPIAEAMYFHCPIVGSDITVFKELLNGHYFSFNPHNIDDIKEKLCEVKKRINKDYTELLARYSFEEMAKKTLQLYQEYV